MKQVLKIALALAMVASVFADSEEVSVNLQSRNSQKNQKPAFFEQGMALEDNKVQHNDIYPSAYNQPAAIQVDRSWDLSVNASFIYWYMQQDLMDLASQLPSGTTPGAVAFQNFGYNPGFQVGLAVDTGNDGWTLDAEYTWYHNTQSQTDVLPPAGGTWTASDILAPFVTVSGVTSVNSNWKLHMDLLDVVAGRPFYQGRAITVSPSGGLRALWIRQNQVVDYNGTGDSVNAGSRSWALGVVGNANTRVMLWKGLRADAIAGASLLYTNYTTVYNNSLEAGSLSNSVVSNLSALRPTLDLGLGLGYGGYCCKNGFFIDLSARYDFNLFWAQNIVRNYTAQMKGYTDGLGDLFLHGLTLNLRVDF